LRGQQAADQPQHRGFTAEQMHATGDVEINSVWPIQRHQRREAVAPVGDVIKHLGVGRWIGVIDLQIRADGAGICERQADVEAEPRRGVVERMDLERVGLLDDDDAGLAVLVWRVVVTRTVAPELALDAVDGQARQPETENPPLALRKGTHHISIP
jgi:hypothetical protein